MLWRLETACKVVSTTEHNLVFSITGFTLRLCLKTYALVWRNDSFLLAVISLLSLTSSSRQSTEHIGNRIRWRWKWSLQIFALLEQLYVWAVQSLCDPSLKEVTTELHGQNVLETWVVVQPLPEPSQTGIRSQDNPTGWFPSLPLDI